MRLFIGCSFLLLFLRLSCDPEAPTIFANTSAAMPAEVECKGDAVRLPVDTAASIIHWRGTKVGGKHEGTVRLASGQVTVCDAALAGGTFTIDMHTIAITDIPPHETRARANLRNHLMDDDFFAVATYPTATFNITAVEPTAGDAARVAGDLTLRGQTHPIVFDARLPVQSPERVQASARFSIDRQRWGVSFRWMRDVLVHDEMHLDVRLVAHSRFRGGD